jgi:hypothetical protein
MTFVHFFIVGPVEELEFRSFAQDQASRILPNWQALTFSSVLFGCSHIPIALFVYQFPPHVFVVAFLGWISAGFVFGALYIWSRNILACIVMHGMGNWQLSIFYFQSTEITGALGTSSYVIVGIASTLVVDGLMILFFYLVHKYYWQPHRRGEPAFGGMFLNLQNFIHDHDFDKKPLQTSAVFLVVFIVVICGVIIGTTHAFGETDLSKFSTTAAEDEGGADLGHLESLVESPETIEGSGNLNEGQSIPYSYSSQHDKYVKGIVVTVTWTDEPDSGGILMPYQNQPDTFSIVIDGLNGSDDASGSNPPGGEGSVTASLSNTLEEISEAISSENEEYEVVITITLDDAGDQESPSGLRTSADNGNTYSYVIEIIWLVPE